MPAILPIIAIAAILASISTHAASTHAAASSPPSKEKEKPTSPAANDFTKAIEKAVEQFMQDSNKDDPKE
jgi:hypothetical protein